MITLLQRLRPFLPGPLWRPLADRFWNRFWRLEEAEQHRVAPMLPRRSLRGSERALLVEAVVNCYPISAVLEIGCAYGQTLHTLAPLLPQVSFVGIDKDSAIVTEGAALLRERNIHNVVMFAGDAADLSRFADGEFGVVYCIACLLYVSEEQIHQALAEMVRVSRGSVILMEQHTPGAASQRTVRKGGGYWLRDYEAVLRRLAPHSEIAVRKVENSLWDAEQWAKFGALIVLKKRSSALGAGES